MSRARRRYQAAIKSESRLKGALEALKESAKWWKGVTERLQGARDVETGKQDKHFADLAAGVRNPSPFSARTHRLALSRLNEANRELTAVSLRVVQARIDLDGARANTRDTLAEFKAVTVAQGGTDASAYAAAQAAFDAAMAAALSLIHISEPTRRLMASRMPSSA